MGDGGFLWVGRWGWGYYGIAGCRTIGVRRGGWVGGVEGDTSPGRVNRGVGRVEVGGQWVDGVGGVADVGSWVWGLAGKVSGGGAARVCGVVVVMGDVGGYALSGRVLAVLQDCGGVWVVVVCLGVDVRSLGMLSEEGGVAVMWERWMWMALRKGWECAYFRVEGGGGVGG
ncbi:hypothetical protein Tco_0877094 [Tanacetum coccineum]|uniref:Uncharacterized protein n=1 Tax=Tanacetum coccineum TaxID=301880 RepID=A0ABQ5BXC6_9ASTR